MQKIFEIRIYDLTDQDRPYAKSCFHKNLKAVNYGSACSFAEEMAFSGENKKKMVSVHECKVAEQLSLF